MTSPYKGEHLSPMYALALTTLALDCRISPRTSGSLQRIRQEFDAQDTMDYLGLWVGQRMTCGLSNAKV